MPLPWVRLDTTFPRNQKVLQLLEDGAAGKSAAFVYVCGLAYAGEQGSDGFLPRVALPQIHGKPVDAKRLVAARLWIEDPGGWLINDWSEYQPSSEEHRQRAVRARAAAMVRWGKDQAS